MQRVSRLLVHPTSSARWRLALLRRAAGPRLPIPVTQPASRFWFPYAGHDAKQLEQKLRMSDIYRYWQSMMGP